MSTTKPRIYTFGNSEQLAQFLAEKVLNLIKDSIISERIFNIALSGGSTPRILFEHIAKFYTDPGIWDNVRFYWVDERCVPPDHPESNFCIAYETFLRYLSHSNEYVFRMRGEEDPHAEAERYSQLIKDQVSETEKIPAFDLVLLGMGGDGHTASIFPGQMELMWTDRLCGVGIHPETGQQRITLTGNVINNAENVFFLVAGEDKAKMVARIINEGVAEEELPAAQISPTRGNLSWFLDAAAASQLTKQENPG
ncbi:6-phosphogluconolactonase [Bacteroidota bacterium]